MQRGRDSARVLELAYLNSYFETGLKSPLDDAILAHSDIDVGRLAQDRRSAVRFRAAPRIGAGWNDGRPRLLVVKGAPEDILRLSRPL